mgnify:CR=1 FL=1
MEESKWYAIYVCTNCEKRLLEHQRSDSYGICPYCGFDSWNKYCMTQKVIINKIKHNNKKWWQFWKKREVTYVGKDEFSQKWLLKK